MFKKFVGLGLVTLAAGAVVYTVAKRIKGEGATDDSECIENENEVVVEEEKNEEVCDCGCKCDCACEEEATDSEEEKAE